MKEVDYKKLFAQADYNIAEEKNDEAKMREVMQEALSDEKKQKTERLADSIQQMIVTILTTAKKNTGYETKYGEFKNYGEPKSLKWKLDEEKFTITIDYSYSISGDSMRCYGPTGFDNKKEISWIYLKDILGEHNIHIDRKKAKREDKQNDWYDTTYYTDIITISLGRELEKEKEPVENVKEKKR